MDKTKKKRKRLIFRSIILALLVGLVVLAIVQNLQKDDSAVDVGDDAPDFQLEQFGKDEPLQLSDYEGKGVMLNFWATYCKPCEEEMPYMQELYPEYKEKGVEIIAVNLDSTKLVVNRFIDKYDLTFPVPWDKSNQVMDLYKIGPIPSTYFINPEGEIERKVIGALTLERLEQYLKEIQPEG
ncbi:thiol-disulfide oxidoreductase ResA [Thalassobacillus hwangdonensis]|uniref:Thiol-disulfide oxidoreductase ResA n=1 Tax=Thalassobacillus hwangdonensis TaxID=546108 RepID=A0ABW3L0F6_9BACI